MTAAETAVYRRVPTDEAEARMLATVDLDGMKSERGGTEARLFFGIGQLGVARPSKPNEINKGSALQFLTLTSVLAVN